MLASWQGLCENAYYLLICGYVLELYNSLLNTVSDEVIPDLYML